MEKKIDPQPNEEVEKSEAADKPEANAGGEKSEDFPSYTEWTKKVLAEEKNKQDGKHVIKIWINCLPLIN